MTQHDWPTPSPDLGFDALIAWFLARAADEIGTAGGRLRMASGLLRDHAKERAQATDATPHEIAFLAIWAGILWDQADLLSKYCQAIGQDAQHFETLSNKPLDEVLAWMRKHYDYKISAHQPTSTKTNKEDEE